jgi:hypothetical protein
MKKLIIFSFLLLSVMSCKKKGISPEGPTDVRIRNISDLTFENVIVSTSENDGDTLSFGTITSSSVSDYFRFTKAYPKAEISVSINIDGSPVEFSTGAVDYTYMQHLGRDRVTYEVYISSMEKRELTISNVIPEEPLVLK